MVNPLTDSHLLPDISLLLESCSKTSAAEWAIGCARHVLSLFEKGSISDIRPHQALEAGERWLKGIGSEQEIRAAAFEAHAAAREADSSEGIAVARACGQAISTVFSKGHALHAATYAAKAAAVAHPFDTNALEQERVFQYRYLIQLLKSEESIPSSDMTTEA